jgi:hypothetical protein
LKNLLKALFSGKSNSDKTKAAAGANSAESVSVDQEQEELVTVPCCSDKVHVAYRGLSDDKLYLSHDRTWQEIKYFKAQSFVGECDNGTLESVMKESR